MSLFGSSPSSGSSSSSRPSRSAPVSSLFADDETAASADSPWAMPTQRKHQSRTGLISSLLPAAAQPDTYTDLFDRALSLDDAGSARVGPAAVTRLLSAAHINLSQKSRIMSLVTPEPQPGKDVALGRPEFGVLVALVALAQEGELLSLDTVDERRKNLPLPILAGFNADSMLTPAAEQASSPPQLPSLRGKPRSTSQQTSDLDPNPDPWNTSDLSRGAARTNGTLTANGPTLHSHDATIRSLPTPPTIAASDTASASGSARGSRLDATSGADTGWSYYDGATPNTGFSDHLAIDRNQDSAQGLFKPDDRSYDPPEGRSAGPHVRTGSQLGAGGAAEEKIIVMLIPEKEGLFMFQHHNYEVFSPRRDSKVVRRYSDFVWMLNCLQKRYPFRVLPLLPPKRVAVNGNHLSNDGAFIEKRRRGLARFLNTVVRHPVLCLEQLVIMFLTVPTELAVWRKQAAISVQDEFTGRILPPGLVDQLPPTLEDLFARTRSGVKRSTELYIAMCAIVDRLVKRGEGGAADHGRAALALASLTEVSADTYATDDSDVRPLNAGLAASSKRLRACQALLEDESRAWDVGVLEDLKRQRDAFVSLLDMFDRRDRLDRHNIPFLERRIQASETKLASLRAKPDMKLGEIDKVVDSIIKDKESIVQQHNRSIFVRECLRDELVYFQATQYHVSHWNQEWAQERVKYAEMQADNWRRLLDELDSMPLGESR